MEPLLDRTILLAACLAAFLAVPPDAASVSLLLMAYTVSTIAYALPERVGLRLLLAYLAFACAVPLAAVFLAPAVYGCAASRYRWVALVWLVPVGAAFLRIPLEYFSFAIAFGILAWALGHRAGQLTAERRQYRVLRDAVREQSLALALRNHSLSNRVTELEDAAQPEDCRSASSNPYPQLALASLTEREIEIAAYVARGLDNKEIAAAVFASEGTVRNHISAILQKSNLRNRTQLAVAYLNAQR